MKSKCLTYGILAFVLISIVLMSGCIQSTSPKKEKFILSENNFEWTSLSHYPHTVGVSTSIDGVCAEYKSYIKGESLFPWKEDYQENMFVITYNIGGVEHKYLDEPLNCYVLVDGIKYYGKIQSTGVQEKKSSYFCDNLYYKGEVGEVCYYARVDITRDTDVTLCCEGICKTKTLLAYCK